MALYTASMEKAGGDAYKVQGPLGQQAGLGKQNTATQS